MPTTFASPARTPFCLFVGVSMAALCGALPAAAQVTAAAEPAANQDIVVTATKRSGTLFAVPFSINAQTEADIQRQNATTIEDISRSVAGLSVQNLGPGQSQVSIRGVSAGQIIRDQPGVKEQVGIYLDESVISLSLFTPDVDLFDLNRVETLRGPQGTLFGSGSVGGTVRYITNQPNTQALGGLVEGNLNTLQGGSAGGSVKGAVNVPLNDKAAVRAVGYYTRYGGFIDALREGGGRTDNINSGERYGGRLSLLLKPTDDISLTPRIVYQKITANGFNRQEVFNLYANPFTTTRPPVTFKEREQFLLLDERFSDKFLLADLVGQFDFSKVAVTTVTSYIDRDILVSRDASALSGSVTVSPFAGLGVNQAAVLLPSNLHDTTKLKQFTQEVRIASTGDGPFQWILGGFYTDIKRTYAQRLPTPGYDAYIDAALGAGTSAAVANGFPLNSPYNADIPYDITQKAIFGEASYRFGERFKLTAGGRYYDFNEQRTFKTGGIFANGDFNQDKTSSTGFSPRFIASYKASNDVTINAQAAKGFRLGGVNDPLNLPLCTPEDKAIFGGYQNYDDETVWNYEAGVKARGHGFGFSAAVFYADLKNLQVTLDAGSCSSRVVFNVPKAHSAGIEFELTAEPLTGLNLSLSGSVLDSKFDSTVLDGAGNVLGGIRDGNRLPSVPKFQISMLASYTVPIDSKGTNGVLTGSFQHVGNRYTQPSDQENNPRSFVSNLPFGGASGNDATVVNLLLPAYNLVNISAGVTLASQTEVVGYINNLFDENPLLSFDRERGGRARLGFSVGQPRTYGVTVRQRF